MATPIFPTEVITNILSRLRVKPLLRFTSVSKSWYSLINSPKFIKLHLAQTLTSDNYPNLLVGHRSLSFSDTGGGGSDKNLRTIRFSDIDHPLKHLPDTVGVHILGYSNGVFLISDFERIYVFLFNPSTKTHRLLPPFYPSPYTNPKFGYPTHSEDGNYVLFGFGYDTASEDYKALRIIETPRTRDGVYREIAVYSLRNNSWKCVVCEELGNILPYNVTLVNDALHFLVNRTRNIDLAAMCFSLRTEKFSTFRMPRPEVNRCSMYVGELGGYLYICFSYLNLRRNSLLEDNWVPNADEMWYKSVVWVMNEHGKEESWVKLFTFSGATFAGCTRQVKPVLYSKDRRRLLVEVDGYWLGWYEIEKNKLKRVKAVSFPSGICETWPYVDSLVSFHSDVVNSKGETATKMVKAQGKPAPSAIKDARTEVDSLVSLLKDKVTLEGGAATKKIKAHGIPAPSGIMEARTNMDNLVSLHKDEVKLKGGTATKTEGKHSVSKEQRKQDAQSVRRTSQNQSDTISIRVRTQISSQTCSTPEIDNFSKDFILRLGGDATDRT